MGTILRWVRSAEPGRIKLSIHPCCIMDYPHFLSHLPALFDDWGQETIRPKSAKFQQVRDRVQGMTTANVMQLLNFAVQCLSPGELYCEIGTYQGTTLIGALLDQGDRMAYAVDNFSEFDEDGRCFAALMHNLNQFGLEEQVYFCNQDFQQFLLELKELNTDDKIGVYFYDGAHDYRSTLLGLLLAKPFLADTALIILDDANWGTVQQASWDFLAASPEAQVELELFTPVARFPTFWNGIQILSWNRQRQQNYPATTFSEKRKDAVVKAIYNVQLLEQRDEAIQLVYQEALRYHSQKQFGEAEQKYREFLVWREQDALAWFNLGLLYFETESFSESCQAFLKAIEFDSTNSLFYYNLGNALVSDRQLSRAIVAYEKAIELDPELVDAYNNLGNLLNQKGAIEQAENVYRQAIAANPTFPGSHLNLGNLFLEQGKLAAAVQAYQTAHTLAPDNQDISQNLNFALDAQTHPTQYHRNFGDGFYQQKQYQTAIYHFQRYLDIQPGDERLYLVLSDCFWKLNQKDSAIATLKAGIQHHSTEPLYYELILSLTRSGDAKTAIAIAEQALIQHPDSYTLKLLHGLTLPWVYDSVEEIKRWRDRYLVALQNLLTQTHLDTPAQIASALAGIGRYSSFQLTYQAQSMLEPQRMYGKLVQTIMAAAYPQWSQPLSMPAVESKIRVGYLTHYFHAYSGTLWLTGWLRHANHQDFEIYCYYTGNEPDAITEEFRQYSDVFRPIAADLETICQQVLADRLHILVFPEIGMDPQTVQLAALRLAPVQCTAWGHPVTSGLSSIDYYLSSQLMEPDNAQAHYSETLVRLPKLGIAYPQPVVPAVTKTRAQFGLRDDAVVYFSGQAPFKYLPQHDYLLVEIARRVPEAQFVFIRSEMLQPRLEQAFALSDLNYNDYCVFLPALSRNDYLMLNQLADVYLDTLGFTGGNTTLDAIACGLPVVTCPGEFMRGRLSSGILQALGVTETIVQTEADYIELAVSLGLNLERRAQLSAAMLQQQTKVFDDSECVVALEAFYLRLTQTSEVLTQNQAPRPT